MYRRKVAKKRHEPLMDRGDLEPVTVFGQKLTINFIIVSKSHKGDKESVVLVIRDEFLGYIVAYPCSKRASDFVVKSLLGLS